MADIHDLAAARHAAGLRNAADSFRPQAERGENVLVPATLLVQLLDSAATLATSTLNLVAKSAARR